MHLADVPARVRPEHPGARARELVTEGERRTPQWIRSNRARTAVADFRRLEVSACQCSATMADPMAPVGVCASRVRDEPGQETTMRLAPVVAMPAWLCAAGGSRCPMINLPTMFGASLHDRKE